MTDEQMYTSPMAPREICPRRSGELNELAAALSKAQSEFAPIKKENSNPFFKSKYADLSTVIEAVSKTLGKHGLSFTQLPSFLDGKVIVTTVLMHSSGQWMSSELAMPLAKSDAQGVGSAITYARRYALQSALGVAAEDDDDGNAAVSKPYEKEHEKVIQKAEKQKVKEPKDEHVQDPNLITVDQRKRLFAISKDRSWSDKELRDLLGVHGFEHSSEVTKAAYDQICEELQKKAAEPF